MLYHKMNTLHLVSSGVTITGNAEQINNNIFLLFIEVNLNKYSALNWFQVTNRNTLKSRHNKRDGVSNHRRLDFCSTVCLCEASKKTSKLRVISLFLG